MNQTGFIIFGVFVLLIWGVALVFRLCAGSKSESAVSDAKTCLQSYETYTARVQALNGIFRSILNGAASPQDRSKLRAYADEYVALSREYGKRSEGHAKALVSAVVVDSYARGERTMLYADTSCPPSNALYRAMGFREAGRLIGFDFTE